jgi:hypothetical protein
VCDFGRRYCRIEDNNVSVATTRRHKILTSYGNALIRTSRRDKSRKLLILYNNL